MGRKVTRRHHVRREPSTGVLDALEGTYEARGLMPDGLPVRVPVYNGATGQMIGWLGYDDKRATK